MMLYTLNALQFGDHLPEIDIENTYRSRKVFTKSTHCPMFQVLLMKGWWLLQAVRMILSHPCLQVQLSQQVENNLQQIL
jgi:hypothetical protein